MGMDESMRRDDDGTWESMLAGASQAATDVSGDVADDSAGSLVLREKTELLETDDAAAEAHSPEQTSRRGGWLTLWRRGRALWITVGVAVLSLVLGLLVGRFALSPADAAAAAEPPKAGPVTVEVASQELSSSITTRGDIGYANATEVTLAASEEKQIVTGKVPALGDALTTLSIALEVSGRPLIVLPGDLPAYRDLTLGMSGPDVTQFKAAMTAAGIPVGDASSPVFDSAAAQAVTALYQKVGYTPPVSEEGSDDTLRAAQDAYDSAEDGLTSARSALRQAGAGAKASEIQTADNQVRAAQRAVDVAAAAVNQAASADPVDANALAQAKATLGDAQDTLKLAQTQRTEAGASPDTSAEAAGVETAKKALSRAADDLQKAKDGTLPSLPANEVLFLGGLPRQVSAISAVRGKPLSEEEPALTVSSTVLEISATVGAADAEAVAQGDEAVYIGDDGTERKAVIATVAEADESGQVAITLTPDKLTPDEIALLQGMNVRVNLPIKSTDGEVLAVPLAAVITGADGGSKVQVVDGDPRSKDVKKRTVKVTTGLAAGDLIEVRPADGDELAEGDLVVVGK